MTGRGGAAASRSKNASARFAAGDLQRPSRPPRQRGNVGVFERKRQAEPTCKALNEAGVHIRIGRPDVMVKMGHAGEADMTTLGELVQDEEQRGGIRSPRDRGDDRNSSGPEPVPHREGEHATGQGQLRHS